MKVLAKAGIFLLSCIVYLLLSSILILAIYLLALLDKRVNFFDDWLFDALLPWSIIILLAGSAYFISEINKYLLNKLKVNH
jgi:hypothetical protein